MQHALSAIIMSHSIFGRKKYLSFRFPNLDAFTFCVRGQIFLHCSANNAHAQMLVFIIEWCIPRTSIVLEKWVQSCVNQSMLSHHLPMRKNLSMRKWHSSCTRFVIYKSNKIIRWLAAIAQVALFFADAAALFFLSSSARKEFKWALNPSNASACYYCGLA